MKLIKQLLMTGVGAAALMGAWAGVAQAAPVDVDITYVIDQSGSMDDEFDFLGGAIGGFLTDLQADASIASAQAALVSYEESPVLQQDLTNDETALSSAFGSTSTFGGTENALGAVDAALPGGNTDLGISYRTGSVRSIILITDEDADDAGSYSNSFGSGASALGSLLDDEGFLNNIISDPVGSGFEPEFETIARPSGALFSIDDFRNDREGFFQTFTQTKIGEIRREAGDIPEPATLGMFGIGLAGLGFAARRRRKSA